MPRKLGRIAGVVLASALSGMLAGCSYLLPTDFGMGGAPPPGEGPGAPGWGQTIVVAAGYAEGETEGPYLLDSGDGSSIKRHKSARARKIVECQPFPRHNPLS
jgi:hypothetical protein